MRNYKTNVCPTCGASVLFSIEAHGSIKEVYNGWLSDLAEEGRTAFYITQLRQRFRDYVLPVLGNKRPQDVKTKDLVTLKRSLFEKKLASKTVKNVLGAVSAFLNHLARAGDLEAVPVFPPVRVRPVMGKHWLSAEAQARIISAAEPADRLIFRLLIETGCRVSEACALQVRDLIDGGVMIARAFDDYGQVKETKTGRADHRPLSPGLWKDILDFCCGGSDPATSFLFQRRPGLDARPNRKPYDRRYLRRRWLKACEKAGAPLIPPSQASRHSKASQARADLEHRLREDLRGVLGHESAATTLKHYALPEEQRL